MARRELAGWRTAIESATGGGLHSVPPAEQAQSAAPLAEAFANTFAVAVAMGAVAVIPIAVLAWSTRHGGRDRPAAEEPVGEELVPAA